MSLRITPAQTHAHSTPTSRGAPSAPGVHDTLRANLGLAGPAPKSSLNHTSSSSSSSSSSPSITSFHPLESRLAQWRGQQDALKMELLRHQFGIAEPVKRGMELEIVRAGEWRPSVLGGLGGGASSNVHADILSGRDAEIDWEDVYTGGELRDRPDFHSEMETQFGMNW